MCYFSRVWQMFGTICCVILVPIFKANYVDRKSLLPCLFIWPSQNFRFWNSFIAIGIAPTLMNIPHLLTLECTFNIDEYTPTPSVNLGYTFSTLIQDELLICRCWHHWSSVWHWLRRSVWTVVSWRWMNPPLTWTVRTLRVSLML